LLVLLIEAPRGSPGQKSYPRFRAPPFRPHRCSSPLPPRRCRRRVFHCALELVNAGLVLRRQVYMLLSSAATRLGTHYAASTLPQSIVAVNRVTIEKPANVITTQTDLRRYCTRLFFEIFDQLLRIILLSLILWKNIERFYMQQFDDTYII